jgi:hypothetical protein
MCKKVLIIESCEKKINSDYSNTSIVHVRNSLIISDILKADLITHESQISRYANNKYDFIICMYASPYMKYKQYFELLKNNMSAKLFWLVNDHDLEDNILLRNAVLSLDKTYDMICNNPRTSYRHWILGKKLKDRKLNDFIINWHTLNLNTLIFNAKKREFRNDTLFSHKKEKIIYYGTFRKYRILDMLDYNGLDYTISTSKKNQHKYKASGIEAKFIDRLKWDKNNETLFHFKYSIYFEDVHTHNNFAFMANRYYECIMCDVLMFFDYRCINTIDKSKYNIPKYLIVKNAKEMKLKVNELNHNDGLYNDLLNEQNGNTKLILNEKSTVENNLKLIFN